MSSLPYPLTGSHTHCITHDHLLSQSLAVLVTRWLIHCLTHSLPHRLAASIVFASTAVASLTHYLLPHSLIRLCRIHPLAVPPSCCPTHCLLHSFSPSLVDSSTGCLTHSLPHPLDASPTRRLAQSLPCPIAASPNHCTLITTSLTHSPTGVMRRVE